MNHFASRFWAKLRMEFVSSFFLLLNDGLSYKMGSDGFKKAQKLLKIL